MNVSARKPIAVLWLAACLAVSGLSAAMAQSMTAEDIYAVRDLERLQRTFNHLAEQARPTVVAIETRQVLDRGVKRSVPNSQGSGFVIRSDGYIATNHHVVEGADEIIVTLFNGTRYDAELVEFDPRSDLAVIHIPEKNLRVAPLGDIHDVRVGQWCFTVGSPFGIANGSGNFSVSFGGVAAIGQSLTDYIPSNGNDRFYGNLIQTDASINPGNSGGPLFDLNGRVIGVNTAMMSRSGVDEGLGYAVPISARTRTILDSLAEGKVVRYGYLGVQVADADRRKPIGPGVSLGKGAVIDALTGDKEHSPAARAGLLPNDVITEFADEAITCRDDLIRVVGFTPVGSEVKVVYYRDQRPYTAMVQLDERVETAAARARHMNPGNGLRTLAWRGAVLVEPTDAFLLTRTNTREKPGIYVAEVPERTALYRRGLREHSLIVAVDGTRVRTLEEFQQQVDAARDPVRLELDNGTTVSIPKY